MVRSCAAYNCKEKFVKGASLSFHSFPSDIKRRKLWIIATKRANFLPSKYSHLCSKHFKDDCFVTNRFGNSRVLKLDAIPSIFDFPEHLKKASPKIRGTKRKYREVSSIDHCRRNLMSSEAASTQSFLETDKEELIQSSNSDATSQSSDVESISSTISDKFLNNPNDKQKSAGPSTSIVYSNIHEMSSSQLELPQMASSIIGKPVKERRARYWHPRFIGDCTSSDLSSPEKAKRNWKLAKQQLATQSKKMKTIQQRNRRLRSRINSLQSLTQHLKEKLMISENSENTILATLPGSAAEVMKRILKGSNRQKYTPELRSFAITLNFYSRKTYDYVRTSFNNSLPHTSTITKWFQSVDGSPGFTKEAINALKSKVEEASVVNKQILCNLVMDEMAIRRQVEWTGSKFTGLVDIGTDISADEVPEAKEVLVFMLVAINAHWKIPVGYFLLNGLCGSERANLVNRCLEFVHQSKVVVTSLTFDGAASNLSMTSCLGAQIKSTNDMRTYFEHPITKKPVFIIPDACHMLKLIRNCLASKEVLMDEHGSSIKWNYFEKLVELQEQEGVHAATKIRKRHIQWEREKMNVKVAAQTFSTSVANAFQYLQDDLNLPEFNGVNSTVRFCKIVNNLFDIFNSRNLLTKGEFKKPLSTKNAEKIFSYLDECKDYLCHLKTEGGEKIINSNRKMGFLGFICGIESLKGFYNEYIKCPTPKLKFLITYKLSQDHLEIFFSAVRSKGGYNNNPTARQFESAYKRLIVHAEIRGSENANSIALDATSVPHVSSRTLTTTETGENMMESEDFSITVAETEHDYCSSDAWHLTLYAADVIAYIAGFVIKRLKRCITCKECLNALESDMTVSQLQVRKTYGRLVKASNFVIDVCRTAERCLRYVKATNTLYKNNIDQYLINTALQNLPRDILQPLHDHVLDQEALNNHGNQLLSLILKHFVDLRLHHETRIRLEKCTENRVRSLLTKSVLFRNQ